MSNCARLHCSALLTLGYEECGWFYYNELTKIKYCHTIWKILPQNLKKSQNLGGSESCWQAY